MVVIPSIYILSCSKIMLSSARTVGTAIFMVSCAINGNHGDGTRGD